MRHGMSRVSHSHSFPEGVILNPKLSVLEIALSELHGFLPRNVCILRGNTLRVNIPYVDVSRDRHSGRVILCTSGPAFISFS